VSGRGNVSKRTTFLFHLLEQQVIVFLNTIFIPSESFVTEGRRPNSAAAIMLGTVTACMHADQWDILGVPLSLDTLGLGACNNFNTIRVGHRDVMWADPYEFAMALMELQKVVAGVQLGCNTEDEVELRESCPVWPRDLVQRVEEKAVNNQAGI